MRLRICIGFILQQLCHELKLELLRREFLQVKQVKVIEIVHDVVLRCPRGILIIPALAVFISFLPLPLLLALLRMICLST